MASADKRVAGEPGSYKAARSAALNALAFLDPLLDLREKLVAADDADAYVAEAESTRQTIVALAAEANDELARIHTKIDEAEARYAERESAFAERMAAAETKAKATASKAQAEHDEAVRGMAAEQARLRAEGEVQARRLASDIDAKRNELRDVERQLSLARAAFAEFQRTAGVGG